MDYSGAFPPRLSCGEFFNFPVPPAWEHRKVSLFYFYMELGRALKVGTAYQAHQGSIYPDYKFV